MFHGQKKEHTEPGAQGKLFWQQPKGVLVIAFALIFVVSGALLIWGQIQRVEEENALKNLVSSSSVQSSSAPSVAQPEETNSPVILEQYQALYELNSDMIGWITIDGTGIDYPVMYTGDDFYLEHGFDQEKPQSGVPYIDKRCTVEPFGTNTILYAHHMKNGTMFSKLLRYKQKSYYNEHSIIRFDTLYEEREYQIIAVFESEVYRKSDSVFKHYNFLNAESKEDFDAYLQGIQAQSLYETGISAEYGDELITLMTCAYHTENGRFVVVAKKIK